MKTQPLQPSLSIHIPFKFLNFLLILFYSFSGFLFYKALLKIAYSFSHQPLAENFRTFLFRYDLDFIALYFQGLSFLFLLGLISTMAHYFPSYFLLESEIKKLVALKVTFFVIVFSLLVFLLNQWGALLI